MGIKDVGLAHHGKVAGPLDLEYCVVLTMMSDTWTQPQQSSPQA